jgi:hypothetical protein
VPWCPTCDRYLAPSTVRRDGTCPTCGRSVDPGAARAATPETTVDDDTPPLPWHFWLLAGALALYLGYRAFQGIEWLARQL